MLLVGVLAVLAVGTVMVYPLLYSSTNCGGNTAALNQVKEYALFANMAVDNSTNHTFQVSAVPPEQREQLARLAHCSWMPNARFFVSTTPLSTNESHLRRLIIVCDTPYSNVPRYWLGSAPPTHAAGFSDGSSALISPAEFAALDRSSFAFLDELYPAK